MRSNAILAAALISLLGASSAIGEVASWNTLLSVGGFAIGQPTKSSSGWVLPVRGDVSGLKTITVKPTQMNSGIACLETRASLRGSTITLQVTTGVAGNGHNAECPAAELGNIAPGTYVVQYQGPLEAAVPLGNVTIAP